MNAGLIGFSFASGALSRMSSRVTASAPQTASVRPARAWLLRSRAAYARAIAIALVVAMATVLVTLRPPHPSAVVSALSGVSWTWMSVALLVNVVSIVSRAEAWRLLMTRRAQSIHPPRLACLSAYGIGLLGNTLLPARAGEAARVVVATRHLAPAGLRSTTVAGAVLAQRCLDVACFALLVAVVLAFGQPPAWILTGTLVLAAAGLAAVTVAILVGRRAGVSTRTKLIRPLRWATATASEGLAALGDRRLAARVLALQAAGWVAQLLVVDLTLRAFSAPVPLLASALVLVLLNGVLAFPLWPGGFGAYQAVVALALAPYGVASTTGLSLGLGIQAVESLVGIGFGLAFAAHEGISIAALRRGHGATR